MTGHYSSPLAVFREIIAPSADTVASAYPINGIDVSSYQGSMDWGKASTKINYAYIRAGAGNDYIDAEYPRNKDELHQRKIPFGLYWYINPQRDWRKTADTFAQIYKDSGSQLPPVYDIETAGGLGKSALESWLFKSVTRFELSVNKSIFIYTSPGFWNTSMPMTTWAKNRGLWDAHWTMAQLPIIPNEWRLINQPRRWYFWQWSANGNSQGAEYGAKSRDIDLDRYNGNAADFYRQFGVAPYYPNDPEPEPEPDPIPGLIIPCYRVRVTSDALNMRSGPSAQFTDIGTVTKYDDLPITDEIGEWIKVEGWIHKSYVSKI